MTETKDEVATKKDFEERLDRLLNRADACSKSVEAELGRLKSIKGELNALVKESRRIKLKLKEEHEFSEEELEELSDTIEILEETFEPKRKKAEEVLRGKEAEYLTSLQYLKAEFENYKRRAEKEKREFGDYLLEGFIRDLLPIKDALEVAIRHAKENEQSEGLLRGMVREQKQITELVTREGLEEIQAEGLQFDPFRHEVVSRQVVEHHPENTVIEVLRKGYLFRGKVIRPAMVKIAIKEQIEGGHE
ncbi:MAG: nucleotide exchange factor GrpE [Methanophagales archaeon ANME-1-THS]|nr:MAG: nucleotide exchange factor GrpE [Methanophagales archaeon ANME-1-THS]